ncbi:MAG: glycosyltransferase [Planctomycetes bacterium]|nr:glycosyltransferase [Planctomycetota bacterium]
MDSNDPANDARAYREQRIAHWDKVAKRDPLGRGRGYHSRLEQVYRHLVAPGQRVLEVGCGRGDLLAAVEPSYGVGVDFSNEMIRVAGQRHPNLHFICADAHELALDATFDVIILSDLLNDLWDVQLVMERLKPMTTPRTRLILNGYSRVWEYPLSAARAMGLATPMLRQNWLTAEDMGNLLQLGGFEPMRGWQEVLLPLRIPLLAGLCNKVLAKLAPFRWLALTNMVVARPIPVPMKTQPSVSVIVAARNESGNIENIFRRLPELGSSTELIFVEGHSKDDTWDEIQRAIARHPERKCKAMRQTGKGKGDAVRMGFAAATGDVLMILDADLTMPPEDLPRFLGALASGQGEFINGVRLIYPMAEEAMRFLNFLGNKFFSLTFTWLLGQPIKDTLCGTKVLWRREYEQIAANRAYFGNFDPFGDFDLLFGAARLNLKIVDLPVRYRQRVYGETNIQRWRHGLLLLKMSAFAALRIKFV